jgi:hypothetical protein
VSRRGADFEVLRFEAVPAPGGAAILELEGEFAGPPPRRTRLLVERRNGSVEVPAITVTPDPWTATFAIALEDLADARTGYALAPDRGALIGLPSPTGAGEQDRYVRMARTANELRHRMTERAAAAEAAELRLGEVDAERGRLAGELETTRAELEAARSTAEDAERTAEACRAQRDSAVASSDERVAAAERATAEAREELDAAREEIRAAEQRADAAERDAAALRARAEAADREAADLRETAADEKDRADDLDERLIAAEDEVRAARVELRNTRARLEALLRERRERAAGRHGYAVADHDEGDAVAADEDDGSEHETTPVEAVAPADEGDAPGSGGDEAGEDERDADGADDADGTDDDAAGGAPHDDPEGAAGEDDDTVRFDSPRTKAVATRPTRTVRIWDEPTAGPEAPAFAPAAEEPGGPAGDDAHAGDDEDDTGERPRAAGVLNPGAVGARYIEPSEARASHLTPERLIVGGALLVLLLVLLLIILGVV